MNSTAQSLAGATLAVRLPELARLARAYKAAKGNVTKPFRALVDAAPTALAAVVWDLPDDLSRTLARLERLTARRRNEPHAICGITVSGGVGDPSRNPIASFCPCTLVGMAEDELAQLLVKHLASPMLDERRRGRA